MLIAIDAMGGDFGPRVTVPAAIRALQDFPDLSILLTGDEALIKPLLSRCHPHLLKRISVQHSVIAVAMHDNPKHVLRSQKGSSIHLAIQAVAERRAEACVSAGNTGALAVIARYLLKMYPGVSRPAICTMLPAQNGECLMLDLGANLACDAEDLYLFALMGSAMAEVMQHKQSPKVGLLNVGEEELKGTEVIQHAAAIMSQQSLVHYSGFVEGSDIFSGQVDVIVCDGISGNTALKTSEGVVRFLFQQIKQAFMQSWYSRLVSVLVRPVLKRLKRSLDPERYNGAVLLGLQGVVVKSHGAAESEGFYRAIVHAQRAVQANLCQKVGDKVRAKQ
ncbi:phosphate:acyl-[acyl carrier protein] acyltransferase [Oceanospirillum multiglobuliferum]|uniref:Phosphate acyltransferase n=1 Tax=Oceanospirillum multiglobuliferum TaxID=64969 RepID=A0A1T4R3B5_9GAMM|nr:phosphate acyltransferase PlsX [Oceanospirillum multiglobuliferum]OPX55260.1 hypothetical protein BTE48_10030 [Oceanospirillum multiglobuliferum]SKA10544.1 phosphate:acyl-[acyl carrier protein] acyltransferase [Oceanospirillum multiglobuliferum]